MKSELERGTPSFAFIRAPSVGYTVTLLMRLAVLFSILLAACQPTGLQLSRTDSELTEHGLYFYRLPDDEAKTRGWIEGVHINSYDGHCDGIFEEEAANPLLVNYTDEDAIVVLTISIGPWSLAWDGREPTELARLDTSLATADGAEYYMVASYLKLRYTDKFGTRVQIGSTLSISETVGLINQLEFVGPPIETIYDPWEIVSCQ